MKHIQSAILVMALALAWSSEASACPNCKEAVAAQTGDAGRVADGFNRSILFMMSMPFLLLGAGTFFVVRAARRGTLPPL